MIVAIRPESDSDRAAIAAVNAAAFPTAGEAKLVDRLRLDGDLLLSLVATKDDAVVGHVAFSRLTVAQGDERSKAVALGPAAVLPRWQRRGLGTALIARGLEMLEAQGEALMFVLGEPAFYRRFGFDVGEAAGFTSDYSGPYFQLLRLDDSKAASGRVHYPSAFAMVG